MKTLEHRVRFVTPAFLGNAEQAAQWRTPPFKALLRQWWRVAEVRGGKPVVSDLHRREGELFGRATDEATTASQVKLRLDWRDNNGSISASNWQADTGKVRHDEAEKAGFKVDAALYLGYGPLDADRATGHHLKRKSALATDQRRVLKLGVPPSEEQRFRDVIRLAHAFGALGSRCRNGWGSLHFEEGGLCGQELAALFNPENLTGREWLRAFSRDWHQALDTDWCHALGRDDTGLLLWRTDAMERWEDVLKTLAEVKIAFRTQFHFKGGGKHAAICDRQVVAYPITNHELWDWEFRKDEKTGKPRKDSSRNGNQVLFKVFPAGAKYVGLVSHLPHGLPTPLKERLNGGDTQGLRNREETVWRQIHELLDNRPSARSRISADKVLSEEAKQQSLRAMQGLTRLP